MFNEDGCILTRRNSFSTFFNVFFEELYFWIFNNLPFSSMFRTDVAEAGARAVKLPGTDDLDCQAGPEMQTRMRRRIQAVDRPNHLLRNGLEHSSITISWCFECTSRLCRRWSDHDADRRLACRRLDFDLSNRFRLRQVLANQRRRSWPGANQKRSARSQC